MNIHYSASLYHFISDNRPDKLTVTALQLGKLFTGRSTYMVSGNSNVTYVTNRDMYGDEIRVYLPLYLSWDVSVQKNSVTYTPVANLRNSDDPDIARAIVETITHVGDEFRSHIVRTPEATLTWHIGAVRVYAFKSERDDYWIPTIVRAGSSEMW